MDLAVGFPDVEVTAIDHGFSSFGLCAKTGIYPRQFFSWQVDGLFFGSRCRILPEGAPHTIQRRTSETKCAGTIIKSELLLMGFDPRIPVIDMASGPSDN